MSSSTKDAEAAWKVIEYFGSEEVLKGYLEGGYSLPISKHMNEVVDKSKVGRMADFAQKEYEAVYPSMPDVAPQGENYRDALWNACLPDGPDIDQTLETLNRTYNEALERALSLGQEKRVIIENYNPLKPNEGKVLYLDK
jgi:multiple sugar transport system substrate-binding protein